MNPSDEPASAAAPNASPADAPSADPASAALPEQANEPEKATPPASLPANLTPMMRQYLEMKSQTPGALLLFRMGDFYELFLEDAREAAQLLGLTLTSREKGDNAIPMAGVPYHALEHYLRKLMEAGRRVAICEQVEDPKTAVGLVKREITRVVTPGTLTDDTLLDPKRSNFLLAIAPSKGKKDGGKVGIAWIDLLTGLISAGAVGEREVGEEVSRLEPSEILAPEEFIPPNSWFFSGAPPLSTRPGWNFSPRNARDLLHRHFGVATLEGFGVEDDSPGVAAAGALLAYLNETQKTDLKHVSRLAPYVRDQVMILDPVTRRSLEVTRTLRENRREGSLLGAIDRTVTAVGARLLADWLSRPLVDVAAIGARQSAIAEWKDDPLARRELRDLLGQTYDVERLIARTSTGRTNPRELGALRDTLRRLPALKARLAARNAPLNAQIDEAVDLFAELRDALESLLVDEPPLALKDGGIVRDGHSAELDELRDLARGGKDAMARFQVQEAERTGIVNLKVGFNKVFGFYLEVNNSQRDKVPPVWHRKQTIKNAERYVTDELKDYERKVLSAEERSKGLEYELFSALREKISARTKELQALASALAQLDCLLGLAELAQSRGYCRPTVTEGTELLIEAGRHPVLDATLPAGRFVPNDATLSLDEGNFLLITGPNMAGKSTYIRQVALITLMAQIGSFVPAARATVGVADRVFSRVGASDELGRGQSTFMVEMTETANILNNATARSLVILDEIGRGTSTYDGVSLAWAIAEHLHDRIGCRCLFATHYHELIELDKSLARLRNRNVAVREWKDEIIFLHQIATGGADRSYGIHVARLAGLPKEVLQRAQQVLEQLERDPFGESPSPARPKKHRRTYHQLSLFPRITAHPVLDELRMTRVESMTPDDALRLLQAWRDRIRKEDEQAD